MQANRRQFLATTLTSFTALTLGNLVSPRMAKARQLITLPSLPYPDNALEPYISARTIGFHYGKHHQGYLDKLNKQVEGTELADMNLEAIIKATAASAKTDIFNNAAQVWNHNFYWLSMRPKGGGQPKGQLADYIQSTFGSFGAFKEEFTKAAVSQFGSGWIWLIQEGNKLALLKTSNAETPLVKGMKPLLTVDVWEHAYYLDYQNRRADYVAAFLDNLVNWDFAVENLAKS